MAMTSRWQETTPSHFPWEREALEYVRERLPDHEPYHAWSNFEFIANDKEELKKLVREAQQKQVGDIPVPPKYGSADFQKSIWWKLRLRPWGRRLTNCATGADRREKEYYVLAHWDN